MSQEVISLQSEKLLRVEVLWCRVQKQILVRQCPKLRQDVAVHLSAHHKTACMLTLSPLACHEAACGEPVKRRFNAWSGRRGSNPRQPAWKAGTLPTELLPHSCA